MAINQQCFCGSVKHRILVGCRTFEERLVALWIIGLCADYGVHFCGGAQATPVSVAAERHNESLTAKGKRGKLTDVRDAAPNKCIC